MKFQSKLIEFLKKIATEPKQMERYKLDLMYALSIFVKNKFVERGQFSTYEEAEDAYKLSRWIMGYDRRGLGAEIRRWPAEKRESFSTHSGYISYETFMGLLEKVRIAQTIFDLDTAFLECEQFIQQHLHMSPREIILGIHPSFEVRREQDKLAKILRPDFEKK